MLARTILIHILIRATLGSVRAPSILEPTNPYFLNLSSFCLIIESLREILMSQKYTCLTLHSARLLPVASHQKLPQWDTQPACPPISQWHLLSPIVAWGLLHQFARATMTEFHRSPRSRYHSAGFSWTSLLACRCPSPCTFPSSSLCSCLCANILFL